VQCVIVRSDGLLQLSCCDQVSFADVVIDCVDDCHLIPCCVELLLELSRGSDHFCDLIRALNRLSGGLPEAPQSLHAAGDRGPDVTEEAACELTQKRATPLVQCECVALRDLQQVVPDAEQLMHCPNIEPRVQQCANQVTHTVQDQQ
jgi:hypothetical protein